VDENFYSLQGPLDALPAGGQIRAGDFQGFAEFVRRRGGDPRSILERHGVDPSTIADPDSHIDCKSFVEVFEYCGRFFEDPLFGLRLARLQEPDVLGCVIALCRAAPTFRDAMRCYIDYLPVVHSPGTEMELVEGEEIAELRYMAQPGIGIHDQSNFHGVLLTMKLLQQIGGRDFQPSYVTLTVAARRKDTAEIEDSLGCKFRRASSNSIAFPARALGRPIANANRLLYRLLSGYLDRVKAAGRVTIVERVEDYVRGSLSSGSCSIDHCARKLGISERSLQLHMSEHGVRFSEVLQQQRIKLAQGYLKQEELSLDEVACLLGYSEQSSFGRAFRRWTGATPQGYRTGELRAAGQH
jgi:AraC-like DNA-binding protein